MVGFYHPILFDSWISIQTVTLSIAGGLGRFWGPPITSIILLSVQEHLRINLGAVIIGLNQVIFGVILLVIILFKPDGLWPLFDVLTARRGLSSKTSGRVFRFFKISLVGKPSFREGYCARDNRLKRRREKHSTKAIAGLIKPYSGKIYFKNIDITGLPVHKVRKLGLSLVLEGKRLFPNLTVWENLLTEGFNIKNEEELRARIEWFRQYSQS